MKIKSFLLSFLLVTSLTGFSQEKKTLDNIGNDNPNQPSFKFETEEFDFGKIVQGESVTHEFKFVNTGTEPLIISKAEGSCGCTVPIYPKEPIMKGQTQVIKVTFNSTGKSGVQDKTVTLTSNAKQNPMIIHIKGTVEKPIEQPTTDKPKN
jgi:hypothetical protein